MFCLCLSLRLRQCGAEDEAAGLKLASPEAFGFTSQSGCVQKPNDQHSYSCNKYTSNRADVAVLHQMTLQWTPPLEAAGAVYKVSILPVLYVSV